MEFSEYQQRAHETSFNTEIGGDKLVYPVLGLVNEAGELAGKLKKFYRDYGGLITPELQERFALELGDVLWYLAETATQMGVTLDTIAELNLEKLAARKANNKIHGDGDNR